MLRSLLLIFTALIPFDNKTSFWLNFGSGFNLTTISLIILIFGWLIKSSKNGLCAKSTLNFPILTFILIMYASVWYGYFNFGYSPLGEELNLYKRFVTSLIFYFIILNSVKDKKTMALLLKVMFAVTVFISILTTKEYLGGQTWHYNEDSRVTIAGMQPNALGSFITQCLPVLLAFALLTKKIAGRLIYFALILICVAGLMFTYSRGAYLSAMISILVITFLAGRKSFIKVIAGSLVVFFFISIFFGYGHIIPVSVKERFDMLGDKEKREQDFSVQTRERIWKIAKEYISQSPIYGYGYNAKQYLLPLDTHNTYLNVLLDMGILGLTSFLLIFFVGFKIALRVYKLSPEPFDKGLSLGLIGSLVAILVGNFFGTRFELFASNGYFTAILGMVARLNSEINVVKINNKIIKVK